MRYGIPDSRTPRLGLFAAIAIVALAAAVAGAATQVGAATTERGPTFTKAKAFDVSKPLRELAKASTPRTPRGEDVRPDRGPVVESRGHSADAALQAQAAPLAIPGTIANFEGLSNEDNFDIFGFRVNPPDPVGDVGPNHYVEMVNLVFGVYSKTGQLLLGPVDTGSLWAGFPVDECTDPSGDPIVLYDQFADRWILSQFTTRGINFPDEPLNPFYNCVAISTTGDPTGSYYRYAFTTGFNFPDYPKYGVWRDSYLITTREFGVEDPSIYGIGVYGLERDRMIAGDPNARAASILLEDSVVPIRLIGDGLLPPDVDGSARPAGSAPAPIVGTQDDDGPYGATFDALNVWEFSLKWNPTPSASLQLKAQLRVAEFDSAYPCGPVSARDCLPQPGITSPVRYLDILSYRQRPTWRLAYRNLGGSETMVTNQSVEAAPSVAGVRWYELRRNGGTYSVRQQGTYAPGDGVHRWMGSIAMDKAGNMGLGYSVVNGQDVFPGIRYTGRLAGDPLGEMTLGEGTVIDGSGVQTTQNSRWGDYTSMNIDPVDDCTFWYVNEYYAVSGTPADGRPWQTRIASFKLPGC
ncbi:MAG TPA: hypothetical protein VFL61_16360 [Gaiellaceae bacterium]|nr:hypothetical protein [Gaiellaceae bacterium]